VAQASRALPDGTVLDGELVGWREDVLPFAQLQQRIGRKKLTPAVLESVPARFLAFDCLESEGVDRRASSLRERRVRLAALVGAGLESPDARIAIALSPLVEAPHWETLASLRCESRRRSVEGLMLKARESSYGAGRQRGAWWKWKIDPWSIDAVMLYAHPGHGRRSNLYTDYTFGVWSDGTLVPVAKAYSGLTDAEIVELDRWIRAHTRERFGPVRSVDATQVFALAFEAIAASARHKSGVALRFPRILRWRRDKPAREADTLANLRALLDANEAISARPSTA
jgi:DNA ligase-1